MQYISEKMLNALRDRRLLYLIITAAIILAAGGFLLTKKSHETACITREASDNVKGVSMVPLLKDGQKVHSLYGYYSCNPVQRGDVAILAFATRDDLLIKKIGAVPGDEISFQGENALLNGTPLVNSAGQKYVFSSISSNILSKQLQDGKVQNDLYLILGDEIDASSFDSRRFGFVAKDHLEGRVIY
ncbi:MAG: signal peptidase I [Candidatus Spechtbacteria bacterium]|nr:signal peptidase I [Candidatus Spechtbacteria bacterium]